MQVTAKSLTIMYTNFQLKIAATISTISSIESLLSSGSKARSVAPATTPGCARTSLGAAGLQFAVSTYNSSSAQAEAAGRRKLQSTPCTATDGTSVSRFGNA